MKRPASKQLKRPAAALKKPAAASSRTGTWWESDCSRGLIWFYLVSLNFFGMLDDSKGLMLN